MASVVSAIENIVSISQFNRGLAGKIFSEVKTNGPKVVMKNNSAEAVILSPDEYIKLMDAFNDYKLLTEAVKRMEGYNSEKLISEKEVLEHLGISEEDLEGYEEVELE